MDTNTAQNLINKTREDYNLIATQFASTRKFNWPDIKRAVELLGRFDDSTKILDIGCGAGRVSELFPEESCYTGLDLSEELIKIAQKQYSKREFLVGNAVKLPFNSSDFDFTLSIAALHHIPSKNLRQKAINEMYRVTKSGGKALISVWYFWDKRNYKWLLPWKSQKISFTDFLMPWRENTGNQVTTRYLHAWTTWELKRALKHAGFKNIKVIMTHRKQKSNLIVIAEK